MKTKQLVTALLLVFVVGSAAYMLVRDPARRHLSKTPPRMPEILFS